MKREITCQILQARHQSSTVKELYITGVPSPNLPARSGLCNKQTGKMVIINLSPEHWSKEATDQVPPDGRSIDHFTVQILMTEATPIRCRTTTASPALHSCFFTADFSAACRISSVDSESVALAEPSARSGTRPL